MVYNVLKNSKTSKSIFIFYLMQNEEFLREN
jgi:hypothetical protein